MALTYASSISEGDFSKRAIPLTQTSALGPIDNSGSGAGWMKKNQCHKLVATSPGGIDHSAYSKRAMAADQVELMRKLGFDKYCLAGHDRGARVSRRLAKDHPDKVLQLALLDIAPTAYIYSNVTRHIRPSSSR